MFRIRHSSVRPSLCSTTEKVPQVGRFDVGTERGGLGAFGERFCARQNQGQDGNAQRHFPVGGIGGQVPELQPCTPSPRCRVRGCLVTVQDGVPMVLLAWCPRSGRGPWYRTGGTGGQRACVHILAMSLVARGRLPGRGGPRTPRPGASARLSVVEVAAQTATEMCKTPSAQGASSL